MSERRLEVLHVISDAGPHPYFRTIAEHTSREQVRLTVGCVGPPGRLQEEMRTAGVATFTLGAASRANYPAATLKLARELRRSRVDVVQTHLVDGSLVGLAAARLARVPLAILTAHHSHEVPFHGRRLLYAERLCAGPLCDRVIAPSRQVADTLAGAVEVPPTKIEVIHHGFDLDRLDPQAADGGSVREELGLADGPVIGAVGRHYSIKNHDSLVRAFAGIVGDFPQATLVLVGSGDTADLAKLAGELSIADRVVLSGPRCDIPDVLAAIDVFVHPALAESFGMVIIEAMAMARPVVSTDVGIAGDVIEDGVSGVLARSPDPEGLASALRRMLESRDRWPQIGAEARRRVQGFTADTMVRAYEESYARWLGDGDRSQPEGRRPRYQLVAEPSGGPASTSPAVSVTLVLYNSRDDLPQALGSIREDVASGLAEALLVDNASPDDSVAVAERELPAAQIVAAEANRGFAAGCNLAWPLVRGRYWMLLNPDVVVPRGGLRTLVEWMDAHPEVGLASPEIVDAAGQPKSPGRAFPSVWLVLLEMGRLHRLLPPNVRGRLLRGPYWPGGDQTGVDWVPGTAMIVRREAVRSAGLLSEEFFVYGEDLEWCWRIRRAGWDIGVCSQTAFVHRGESSAARTWDPEETQRRIAHGIYHACRETTGGVRARLFAATTALALGLESAHPLRPGEHRRRARQLAGLWLEVARSGTDAKPNTHTVTQ
jgi:glycosyltransferase involved in cell wall biosynthesis/GT2 family glycosyltransferase